MARREPWGPQGVACGLLVLAMLGCCIEIEVQWRWWWVWASGELVLLAGAGLLSVFEDEVSAWWRERKDSRK